MILSFDSRPQLALESIKYAAGRNDLTLLGGCV
jgi:hypothetical protein